MTNGDDASQEARYDEIVNKLEALLNQKIQQDFEAGRTVVVNGWVLSQTEARQCALFSSQA